MTSTQTLPEHVSLPKPSPAGAQCPNCHGEHTLACYGVQGIPVHSCLLMGTREEALGFPTGNLELTYCQDCGFLFNRAFDADVHSYSTTYEETQGFSPTFSSWAKSLAKRLAARHSLRGKTVLEIGCGKGEFLTELCRIGGARGIGVDPSYVPERQPDPTVQIEFIQDFYGPKYSHLAADFVCCRHTLEHIAPTLDFLRGLRETLGDRKDTIVFFEVPDILRELEEGAFWDIYYEHCSYFSPGSLARLFRSTGFEVVDLELDYGGQYILITARPVDATDANSPALPLETDLARLEHSVTSFSSTCSRAIGRWHDFARGAASRGERTVVWGSGSKGVAFLTTLGLKDTIEYVVDINPYRQGKFMPGSGQPIVGPEFLTQYRPDHVIVMNPIYTEEIGKTLADLGLSPDLHAV